MHRNAVKNVALNPNALFTEQRAVTRPKRSWPNHCQQEIPLPCWQRQGLEALELLESTELSQSYSLLRSSPCAWASRKGHFCYFFCLVSPTNTFWVGNSSVSRIFNSSSICSYPSVFRMVFKSGTQKCRAMLCKAWLQNYMAMKNDSRSTRWRHAVLHRRTHRWTVLHRRRYTWLKLISVIKSSQLFTSNDLNILERFSLLF